MMTKSEIIKRIDIINPEVFFFAGFIPYLLYRAIETTTFPMILTGVVGIVFVVGCAGIMLIKTIFYDSFTKGEIAIIAIMLLVGALTYVGCHSVEPMLLIVTIIAARGIDFDKILKVWLVIIISVLVIAFVASQIGLIPNWVYSDRDFFSKERITRTSYGICFPTDCAAHIFFIVLTAFYLRRDKLRIFDYFIGIMVGILTYAGTRGKLDSACIVLTVIAFAITNIVTKIKCEKVKNVFTRICGWAGILIIPILAIAMIALSNRYEPGGELEGFNGFLTGRLFLSKAGLDGFGIKLLGQRIQMYGAGGGEANVRWDKYNFLDSSYINILIINGLIFFILLMIIYVVIGIRNRKNSYFMVVLVLLAINCFVAHHMIEIEYNIFTLALFASVSISTNNKGILGVAQQTE